MKFQRFAIVISFFFIWLSGFLTEQLQMLTAFLLVFSFGILHGANDLVILNKMQGKNDSTSYFKNLLFYILTVFSTVFLLYLFPILGVLIFVLISAYHFGEQHWLFKLETDSKLINLFVIIYGSFILLLLFQFHSKEVKLIVFEITNYPISEFYIKITFKIVALLLAITTLILFLKTKKIKNILILETFLLVVFSIIFKVASLLWGFAIYFVFWHSIPSLIVQVKYLYGNWNKKTFLLYCKSAALYWIVSLIGIGILFYFLKEKKLFQALFFCFLAAITFPHIIVMIYMFQKNNVDETLLND